MAGGKKSVIRAVVVIIVLLLLLIIAAGVMIRLDVLGLGTKVVGPYIKETPVLNMILPEMPEETGEGQGGYNFETIEEAVEILQLTEKMLKEKDEEAENLSEQLTQSAAEVERLKVFENHQLQFEKDKAEFDAQIASSAEAVDFKAWFETMYPENAAKIYADVVDEVAYSEEEKGLISIYQNMKADEAAEILETMAVTKLDQVATIIKNVSSDQAAKIMGAMEPATAAKITTYLSPEE